MKYRISGQVDSNVRQFGKPSTFMRLLSVIANRLSRNYAENSLLPADDDGSDLVDYWALIPRVVKMSFSKPQRQDNCMTVRPVVDRCVCQAPFTRYNRLYRVYTACCQTNSCSFNTVVKQVVKPFDNRFDNRLFRVNGVSESRTTVALLLLGRMRFDLLDLMPWRRRLGTRALAAQAMYQHPPLISVL